jgi:NAD(P)H-hydrate epimerase
MRYLPDSEEMRRMDAHTIHTMGIPSIILMEHAAQGVVSEMEDCLSRQSLILVLCGSGNNGADGLAAARLLSHKGYEVHLALVGNEAHATEEWHIQRNICAKLGIPVYEGDMDGECLKAAGYTHLVDCLFGTGLSREVGGAYFQAITAVNSSGIYTVSVDIPSGISSDTGAVMGCAVKADMTVAIHAEKLGMALYPGHGCCGKIKICDIGITKESAGHVSPKAYTLDSTDLAGLPARPAYSNKGSFGKLLILGGTKNMSGAAYLSGLAAYRSGAGLVKIMTCESNRTILQQLLPEALLVTYPDPGAEGEATSAVDVLKEAMAWATAIVAGPGLGTGNVPSTLMEYLLRHTDKPLLIDADGLNIIAARPGLKELIGSNVVITPHLGEMSRLSAVPIAEIQSAIARTAADFSRDHGCVTVLKDARTVVAFPDGRLYVNTCGNSGMATGGSGDVLSGAIGGMLAAGSNPREAAVYGTLRHSLAGDLAAADVGERALIARDIAWRLI